MKQQVAVDVVAFSFVEDILHVLLIERGIEPFKGKLALPGGFVTANEDLDEAARRELLEETGTRPKYIEQLFSVGNPKRDPRGYVVSVCYLALFENKPVVTHGSDAAHALWVPVDKLPKLAFDHEEILRGALDRLKNKMAYSNIGLFLLEEEFVFSSFQKLYEVVLGQDVDKRNFKKKVDDLKILRKTDRSIVRGVSRPAALCRKTSKNIVYLNKQLP